MWIQDSELAETFARMPWFTDGITEDEGWVLRDLYNIATTDSELANMVASLPWFTDSITEDEGIALNELRYMASTDADLAKMLAAFLWLGDGSVTYEASAIITLRGIAEGDLKLARTIATLPWFIDGVAVYEASAILELGNIAESDLELARTIATLPWFTDGPIAREASAILDLRDLAESDLELAKMIANLAWFTDGLTSAEIRALYALDHIVSTDVELAWQLAASTNNLARDLDFYVLDAIVRIAGKGADALRQLTSQPWYADGLNDEEAALVVILGDIFNSYPLLYQDLLHSRFTQTRTVSLPLAGDVNIYIIQSEPFPPGEDLMTTIEDTARISEEFLGVPFPTTDIILFVIVPKDYNKIRASGKHRRTYMRVVRRVSGRVRSLHHETAHYYHFPYSQWLGEGWAEFIVEYVSQQTDHPEMDYPVDGHSKEVQSLCLDRYGIENIRHDIYLSSPSGICPYYMGENFLWNIYDSIGKETVSAALSELHLSESWSWRGDVEEEIYQVFLKHTPDDKKEDLRDLYRRLHGGAFAFNDVDFDDDHGDEAGLATKIAVGEAVVGDLDYMFDFDYFKFHAEEGSMYRMVVTHDTLRSTSIGLYAPDGVTGENQRWIFRDSTTLGPTILWIAPSSDEYYFVVQNFGGKTGTYTLTVTTADSTAPDDHGDTIATATGISLGEVVHGTVDDYFDFDYFQFQAWRGKSYRIVFTGVITDETHEYFRHHLYTPGVPHDVSEYRYESRYWRDSVSPEHMVYAEAELELTPSSSGTFYLAIYAPYEIIGSYTVTITAAVDD